MGALVAKIELTNEYGHPGNRPSESHALKKMVERLNEILDKEAEKGGTGLAHWYLKSIRID